MKSRLLSSNVFVCVCVCGDIVAKVKAENEVLEN